jgi:hypothetical protein
MEIRHEKESTFLVGADIVAHANGRKFRSAVGDTGKDAFSAWFCHRTAERRRGDRARYREDAGRQ